MKDFMSKRNNEQVIPSSPEDKNSKKHRMEDAITEILNEMRSLKQVSTSTNEAVNIMTREMKKFSLDLEMLNKNIKKIDEEVFTLKSNLTDTDNQINSMQQQLLKTSFIITGLPPTTRGEVFPVLEKIFMSFNCKVKKEDFKTIYMVQHKNKKGAHISGTFYCERKRDEAFELFKQAIKKEEPVLTEKIFETLPMDSVFRGRQLRLRSQLTLKTRNLLDKARTLRDRFRYIWETDGRILIKKNDGEKVAEVLTLNQIDQLTLQTPVNPVLQAANARKSKN